jgi:hypothetical protein
MTQPLANVPFKNVVKKCLNFSIRSGITFRDGGRVQMKRGVQADSDLFAFTSFIVPVETSKWRFCSKVLKVP